MSISSFHPKKKRLVFAYRNRHQGNPLFFKKKQSRSMLKNGKLYVYFLSIIMLWFFWFFFFSERLFITQINIASLNETTRVKLSEIVQKMLEEKKWGVFQRKNIFFFREKELEKKIQEQFFLESLTVKKKYFHTLDITATEKISEIYLMNSKGRFVLDQKGIVIEEIPTIIEVSENIQPVHQEEDTRSEQEESSQNGEASHNNISINETEKGNLPIETQLVEKQMKMNDTNIIIYASDNNDVTIGQRVFDENKLKQIISFLLTFKTITERKIQYLEMPEDFSGKLIFYSDEKWSVWLQINKDIEKQLKNFEIVYKEKFSQDRKGLEYIDLRFEERVYYK